MIAKKKPLAKVKGKKLQQMAKQIIFHSGIDFCPCCGADLPPNHSLRFVFSEIKIDEVGIAKKFSRDDLFEISIGKKTKSHVKKK